MATLRECVSCGRSAIESKPTIVALRCGAQVEVWAQVCADCGEQYFDVAAMERIEAARRTANSKPRR